MGPYWANCGWHRFFRDARVVRHESAIRQLQIMTSVTRYFTGHAQTAKKHVDQPGSTAPSRTFRPCSALSAIDGLTVSPRVQAFAVVSMGEKSLGGMVLVWTLQLSSTPRHLRNVVEGNVPRKPIKL